MPTTAEAVVAVLLAIAPGYLAVTVWARARTWRGPVGDLRTVLESLAATAVVHLLASPVTITWLLPKRDELADYPERFALWAALVVLGIPLLLGGVAGVVSNRWRIGEGQPSAWDWLFTRCPPNGRFIVVEFGDGRRVAGVYADGAMAVTSPDRHGLYLCPEWVVDDDGELVEERPGSGGLLIPSTDDVRWVRVLDPGGTDAEEPAEPADATVEGSAPA